ncbi:MAG: prephenate dehydratase [Bryobacteraceae bacterium]|nr:prephenate dehydratase [Bryobacteraceae bacterium]MDW8377817.1 prephenate dehydratase [Bryobacterales bacterium]
MKSVRTAFQGELGAFSHMAVQQLLGKRAQVIPCERFEQVFRLLAKGEVDAAVVPIENTLHGSVHENYDHLLQFDLPITAETSVRIIHNLIAIPSTSFKKIESVYSHPVALNQCLNFFAAHPHLQRIPFYDTAGSVKMVMNERRPTAAAIASSMAAEIYGAKILKRSIEDDRQNFTRFFLLQRPGDKPLVQTRAERKTSLVFSTRNTPGSLFRALSALALRDLNLTKIESRPLRGKPWEYLFYVDVVADVADPRMRKALGHLEELADFLKVLGSYPRGK